MFNTESAIVSIFMRNYNDIINKKNLIIEEEECKKMK